MPIVPGRLLRFSDNVLEQARHNEILKRLQFNPNVSLSHNNLIIDCPIFAGMATGVEYS